MAATATNAPALLVAASLLLACPAGSEKATDATGDGASSGASSGSSTGTEPGTTGAETSTGTTGALDPCAEFVGLATPEEIAATPRADADAELLALEASDSFVAPQPLHDRVTAELAAIRALQPAVADIAARSRWALHGVLLSFTPEAWAQLADYDAWDCANAYYGAEEDIILFQSSELALIHFPGLFDFDALAAEYQKLPGVENASSDGLIGDASDVCLEIVGTDHAYIFKRGGGDCPAGCNENQYWAFRVDAAQSITALEFWDNTQGDPPPAWWDELADCRARL